MSVSQSLGCQLMGKDWSSHLDGVGWNLASANVRDLWAVRDSVLEMRRMGTVIRQQPDFSLTHSTPMMLSVVSGGSCVVEWTDVRVFCCSGGIHART